MLGKNAVIGLLVFAVLLPSSLWAQEMMHGKWWHDRSIMRELELTDSERKVLEQKYTESRRRMIDLKSEVEKQRFELDLLLGAEEFNREKILAHYDNLETARRNLSRERLEMLMSIRETIGVERFQDLKLMYRDRDRNRKDRKSSYRDRYYKDRDRYED